MIQLPRIEALPIDADFYSNQKLFILYSDGFLAEFDLATNRYTDWTRKCLTAPISEDVMNEDDQSTSVCQGLVEEKRLSFYIGVCVDSSDTTKIFIYGPDRLSLIRKNMVYLLYILYLV